MPDQEQKYEVRIPQLKLLRDLLARNDGDIEKSVAVFVENYVHQAKKDPEFWGEYAEKIKADPDFIDNFAAEQRAPKKPAVEA